MMYLFVPMFGLYLLGIGLCKYFPPSHEQYVDDEAEQVAV
jgi:Sec-independent protein secretion pathway component TatC